MQKSCRPDHLFRFSLASFGFLWLVCGGSVVTAGAADESLRFTPFSSSGIYQLGELVGWKVQLNSSASNVAKQYDYVIKLNNWKELSRGQFDLTSGSATFDVEVNEPAMIFVEVTPQKTTDNGQAKQQSYQLGAAVAPDELAPVVERPADFAEFWQAKIKELHDVEENCVVSPAPSDVQGVEYATFCMDNIHGTHVYGQMAKPAGAGKLPALVIYQWASPPYPLQKEWVTWRAKQGWLVFNVSPHNVLPVEPQEYYDRLPERIKHYESIGNDDRDKSYFLRMYLGDYRALDYVTHRDDWDGKTLVVLGTSMGGQQALAMAGLHPRVSHLIVNVPAGCDTNGPLHGRQASYPNFPSDNARVMETALYFDAVSFSRDIRATSLVAMGFVDTVSAPAGIWTAFNQIAGPKEVAPMVDSPHNHLATAAQQRPFTERSEAWLRQLVRGENVQPRKVLQRVTVSARGNGTAKSAPAAEAPQREPIHARELQPQD